MTTERTSSKWTTAAWWTWILTRPRILVITLRLNERKTMKYVHIPSPSPTVVGPTKGGTSEGFRFKKLAEKSEDAEDASNDDGFNSFSNPNYENPEVGTKTESAIASAPTLFGKLVSVEEKEAEDNHGSDENVDRHNEIEEKDEKKVKLLFRLLTHRQKF